MERDCDLREHAAAAPAVRAADPADARTQRSRRGAETEYPHRHELPLLRGRGHVLHRQAQAPIRTESACSICCKEFAFSASTISCSVQWQSRRWEISVPM